MFSLTNKKESDRHIGDEEFDHALEDGHDDHESTYMTRIQLVLAEKRTSLSVLRTGMVLITLPMSIVAFLVTTSSYYDPMNNLVFLIPLFLLNTFLVVIGVMLVLRAWRRIKKQDRVIEHIKLNAADLILHSEDCEPIQKK